MTALLIRAAVSTSSSVSVAGRKRRPVEADDIHSIVPGNGLERFLYIYSSFLCWYSTSACNATQPMLLVLEVINIHKGVLFHLRSGTASTHAASGRSRSSVLLMVSASPY